MANARAILNNFQMKTKHPVEIRDLAQEGPSHAPTFLCEARVSDLCCERASGDTKKTARAAACQAIVDTFMHWGYISSDGLYEATQAVPMYNPFKTMSADLGGSLPSTTDDPSYPPPPRRFAAPACDQPAPAKPASSRRIIQYILNSSTRRGMRRSVRQSSGTGEGRPSTWQEQSSQEYGSGDEEDNSNHTSLISSSSSSVSVSSSSSSSPASSFRLASPPLASSPQQRRRNLPGNVTSTFTAKSVVMEYCQKTRKAPPHVSVRRSGSDHCPVFEAELSAAWAGDQRFVGRGGRKKEAELDVFEDLLSFLVESGRIHPEHGQPRM